MLLDAGVEVDEASAQGATALYVAVSACQTCHMYHTCHKQIVTDNPNETNTRTLITSTTTIMTTVTIAMIVSQLINWHAVLLYCV